MLLKLLLCLVTASVACQSDIPRACKYTTETHRYPTYFNMNDAPLNSRAFVIKLSDESAYNCSLNLTEVVPKMKLPEFPIFQILGIICRDRNRIYLTEYSGRAKHIIIHTEIKHCSINLKSLDNLLTIGDTRVLVVTGKIEPNDETVDNDQNAGLNNLVTFLYEKLGSENQSLTHVLKINSSYPELAEIMLKNITIDVQQNQMSKMFPNLQSLELPRNRLTSPSFSFPWTDTVTMLPRHLSRSPLMQNHYSAVDFIKVPSNVFRRYFNLEGNEIKNLSEYIFHGHIDKLSLKGNGLYAIGSKTFRNLTSVQNIDLSNNMLQNIPRDSFKGLRSLQKLELGGNMIITLLADIFDDLSSLRYLGLANNSLTTLPTAIFHPLQNIEVIRLEHNQIVRINPDSFSLSVVKLKEIHFQFNPITDLPYFPFYLRGLKLVNFRATNISFGNFTDFLLGFVDFQLYNTVVDTGSDSDVSDVLKRDEVLRKVDLSDCNITNIQLTKHLPQESSKLLTVFLLHYKFDLTNNPIKCDCNINPLVDFMNGMAENGSIPKNDYYFNEWICQSPTELNGHKMLSVNAEVTYCEVNVPKCPRECVCYKRTKLEHLIVDCRDKGLDMFHTILPDGKLELWYSGNNITNINNVPYPERIVVFDVSRNKLESLSGDVVRRMTSLHTLRFHSNVLAYIPKEITNLVLKSVTIFPNALTCDCYTLWLKNWIRNNKNVILNWNKVSCKVENEEGMVMLEVPDDKFTCDEEFDQLGKVVLPTVTCSVLTMIFMIIFAVVYAYRLECKVLMFVYFGIHPFDRDSQERREHLDCVIVHSGLQTEWVMDEIVTLLENQNYDFVVCDMARDFVIGYSFQENLTRTVRHSKRMIVCLSDDWQTTSDSFITAWRIAQEKIRATRSHYGIIVSHGINRTNIHDKDLNRFIKRGRFVDSKDRLFRNKIIYYMPQVVKPTSDSKTSVHFSRSNTHMSRCFIDSVCKESFPEGTVNDSQAFADSDHQSLAPKACMQSHAFISYHKNDFDYVLNVLLPLLEEKGFSCCISDRDFVAGASIEENILNAVERSDRTIFILTPAHVQDEWSLFTFRVGYERALREKSNHLLVIIKEDVDFKDLDEEIRHYLKNYICLHINDRWFQKKLFNGMPLLKDREDLHTSPLFLKCSSVDENDVKIDVK